MRFFKKSKKDLEFFNKTKKVKEKLTISDCIILYKEHEIVGPDSSNRGIPDFIHEKTEQEIERDQEIAMDGLKKYNKGDFIEYLTGIPGITEMSRDEVIDYLLHKSNRGRERLPDITLGMHKCIENIHYGCPTCGSFNTKTKIVHECKDCGEVF